MPYMLTVVVLEARCCKRYCEKVTDEEDVMESIGNETVVFADLLHFSYNSTAAEVCCVVVKILSSTQF